MANKSSTVKINFQFDEKALKNVTGLLKNLTTVMGGLQKKTIATNRSLDAMSRKLAKLENSPLLKKGIDSGLFKPSKPAGSSAKPKLAGQSSPTYFPGGVDNTLINSISGYGDNAPKVRKQQERSNSDKEKAENKTLKDQQKKQNEDEKKAKLESIKKTSQISLAFDILKSSIKFVVDAFKKLMEIMQKFGQDAGRVNDAGFLANTYKYDVENVVRYQKGFKAASVDEGAFAQIAEFLAPLRDRENANMTAAGRHGLGQREEALSVLSQDLPEEVAALREAISGGTEQDMINAVLRLFTSANASGSSVTGRVVGAETGIGSLSGFDDDRNAIVQGWLEELIVINEQASLDMTNELEKFNTFFQNIMQENMPLMVQVMEGINRTLIYLKPVLDDLMSVIVYLMGKLGMSPEDVVAKEKEKRIWDAYNNNDPESYFAEKGTEDSSIRKGYQAIEQMLGKEWADFLSTEAAEVLRTISTVVDEGKTELNVGDDRVMAKMIISQLAGVDDLFKIDWKTLGAGEFVKRQQKFDMITENQGDIIITTTAEFSGRPLIEDR